MTVRRDGKFLARAGRAVNSAFAFGRRRIHRVCFDERGDFTEKRCNLASVDLEPLIETRDVRLVRGFIKQHYELTGSKRAKHILDNWTEMLPRFIKIFCAKIAKSSGNSGSMRSCE